MVSAVQIGLIPHRDVIVGALPYFHIYGVSRTFATPVRQPTCHSGAVKLIFYPFYRGLPMVVSPKFDPEKFCRSIERYKVTVAFVVPPIILVLVHHPGE